MANDSETFEEAFANYRPAVRRPFDIMRLKPEMADKMAIVIRRGDIIRNGEPAKYLIEMSRSLLEHRSDGISSELVAAIESEIDSHLENMCLMLGLDFVSRTGEVVAMETVYHG